jgi:hypothetical protein
MNDRRAGPDQAPGAVPSPAGAATSSQLRDDIDSGRTRDKVAHSDPAAAPLGTDDEAAGTPPTGEQVSTARRHEAGRDVPDPSPADQPPMQAGMAPGGRFVWLIVGLVVVCALAGIALSL